MNVYVEIMDAFKMTRLSRKPPASVSDWESVRKGVLEDINALHTLAQDIQLSRSTDPRIHAARVMVQMTITMSVQFTLEMIPVGRMEDFADMHEVRLTKRIEEWAKGLADQTALIGARNESGRVN